MAMLDGVAVGTIPGTTAGVATIGLTIGVVPSTLMLQDLAAMPAIVLGVVPRGPATAMLGVLMAADTTHSLAHGRMATSLAT